MYPSKRRALELLHEANVLNEGAWIQHSLHVAQAAEILAEHAGLNTEKAYVLGLLHDIGKRYGAHSIAHTIYGYLYLHQLGFEDAARVCLTHTFNTQSVDDYCGKIDVDEQMLEKLQKALSNLEYDDYDRLIQLCDSIADDTGIVDQEQRMDDICRRHGSYSAQKRARNQELKAYFEDKTGCDLYTLLHSRFQMSA